MILTLTLTVAAVVLIAFAIGTSRAAAPRAGAPGPGRDDVFEELAILDVALDGELDGDFRPDHET
jgi:hypothetical protein